MTPEEVNRFLAEKVMGWIALTEYHYWYWTDVVNGGPHYVIGWDRSWPVFGVAIAEWNPYHNPAQAFMVVEALRSKGWAYKVWAYATGGHTCVLTDDTGNRKPGTIRAFAETSSTAICLAAVEASKTSEPKDAN